MWQDLVSEASCWFSQDVHFNALLWSSVFMLTNILSHLALLSPPHLHLPYSDLETSRSLPQLRVSVSAPCISAATELKLCHLLIFANIWFFPLPSELMTCDTLLQTLLCYTTFSISDKWECSPFVDSVGLN